MDPRQGEFDLDPQCRVVNFALFRIGNITDMRDDYIKQALGKILDPNILINVVSRRVKQLRRGSRPLVESLEKLASEDIALREIIDGKISFETGEN